MQLTKSEFSNITHITIEFTLSTFLISDPLDINNFTTSRLAYSAARLKAVRPF